ncbi:SulP family inorganic anion transporter [Flavicella sp.]|uniref:SulP family inorganic anion transporter n=1 Tax=Flavicella sp. TaxID=2957742 RepID=UPI0026133E93|nr:SulP family inorganic anion transporter [Flavicella sp.]MDG1804720.1 SulP family inorganic anion transporter [Flavicella sp.]
MFKSFKSDLPASIVVFFVALPLCLGIALASGAPPFAGMIAGIIGGIVVGSISGSQIGVSGPAAGLAAIVMTAITDLGGYENFLVAVVIGGIIQILFGIIKAGVIGYYFPSSVIKGMLVGIGIIIILKQIPHFFGYDTNPEGDFDFFQVNGNNTFSDILNAINSANMSATLIGTLALILIIYWSNVLSKKGKFFTLIQGPFVAVIMGVVYYSLTKSSASMEMLPEHLVKVPIPESVDSFLAQFSLPNFAAISNKNVWITGFTIALVASLETLLCVEATDKIDPKKRITPTNRELFAQGTGNILSGMIGGLPITQVIVRSSANIQSGGQTKLSAIVHGFLLLISVIAIPTVLNMIPLAVLAAILLIVGYKLANPATFKKVYKLGWQQFVPFIVTVLFVQYNLLVGIGIGLVIGILVVLYKSYLNSHFLHIKETDTDHHYLNMEFAEEVTFFNKGAIMRELEKIPNDTYLEINLLKTRFLDNDIIEVLEDFLLKAKNRNINIKLNSKRGVVENPESFVEFFNNRPKSKLSIN